MRASYPAGFDSHQWYQQLFDYGMPQDPSLLDPNDPDANLVPQLVQASIAATALLCFSAGSVVVTLPAVAAPGSPRALCRLVGFGMLWRPSLRCAGVPGVAVWHMCSCRTPPHGQARTLLVQPHGQSFCACAQGTLGQACLIAGPIRPHLPQQPLPLHPQLPRHTHNHTHTFPPTLQKLVLPLAKQLLTAVWSPYSRRQSRAAAAMLADLMVYVPAEEEALVELVAMVQGKLDAAVEGLALPAWPPAALAASRRAALHLARRFGRGLRLLAGVCAFDGSLPRAALQRLALDKLVAARLLPYARAAAGNPPLAADRVSRIVGALPAEWFRPSAPPPRGGEAILELLTALARVLEAQAPGGDSASVLAQAARQVASALHKLGDVPKANKLAKAYGVL